jgi:hypothetical protein
MLPVVSVATTVMWDYAWRGRVSAVVSPFFAWAYIYVVHLKKTTESSVGWLASSSEFQATLAVLTPQHSRLVIYEGESNENRKTEIKIRNIAPLSYKLADMLPML